MDVVVCGLIGGSGSGKSTLARSLVETLGPDQVAVLPFDAYYRDMDHLDLAGRAEVNWDHPSSLDVELFVEHLDGLRRGEAVGVPVYDFTGYRRTGDWELVEPRPIVVAEGILLGATEETRLRLDLSVFLDVPEEVRFRRRLSRDVADRGRSPGDVERQFRDSVAPMHDEFVQPASRRADLVVEHPWDTREVTDRVVDSLRTVGRRTYPVPLGSFPRGIVGRPSPAEQARVSATVGYGPARAGRRSR